MTPCRRGSQIRRAAWLCLLTVGASCSYDWDGVSASNPVAGVSGAAATGGTQERGGVGGEGAESGGRGGQAAAGGGAGDGGAGDGGAGVGGARACIGDRFGFETGLEGWEVLSERNGNKHELDVQSDGSGSGEQALEIDTTGVVPPNTTNYELVVASSALPVTAGETVSLDALAQVESFDENLPSMGLFYYDAADGRLGLEPPALVAVTSTQMARVEANSFTVPTDAVEARIVLVVGNDSVLRVDDLCLTR